MSRHFVPNVPESRRIAIKYERINHATSRVQFFLSRQFYTSFFVILFYGNINCWNFQGWFDNTFYLNKCGSSIVDYIVADLKKNYGVFTLDQVNFLQNNHNSLILLRDST